MSRGGASRVGPRAFDAGEGASAGRCPPGPRRPNVGQPQGQQPREKPAFSAGRKGEGDVPGSYAPGAPSRRAWYSVMASR